MIAAETAIGNYIQSLRHTEVENSKGVRKLSTWRTVARELSPPASFGIFLTDNSYYELRFHAHHCHRRSALLERI